MNRKRNFLIILLLVSSALPLLTTTPIAEAYSKTTYIVSDYDDVWMTEAGNVFGLSSMVIMLEESIGLHSFLRFQNVDVTRTIKINNATLYVYAGEVQAVSPGASVTIYGIDEPDCTPFTVGTGLWSLSRPYTSASVNWNLTSWSMGWHSVDVTNIVEEIVNQYAWSKGNDLGFQILGASDTGHESRSFEDYHHPYRETHAKLTIIYDVIEEEEEPPVDDVEFVEQYGEYTIWIVDPPGAFGYDQMDYVFTAGVDPPYNVTYDDIPGMGPIQISATGDFFATGSGCTRTLVRMSDGALYAVYNKKLATKYQIYIKKSEDNGTTWTDETRISTYSGMESYDQDSGAIAVDSDDHLHVMWQGKATGYTTDMQIWHRSYTTSWGDITRTSTDSGMSNYPQKFPSITVDSNDYLHITWTGMATGYTTDEQIWHRSYTTSWGAINRISTYSGMNNYDQRASGIAVDSNDYLHVTWRGMATGLTSYHQAWYSKYIDSWAYPVLLSTVAGMSELNQGVPSIAIDSNDYIQIAWTGESGVYPSRDQAWYITYTDSWSDPIRISTGMGEYENFQCTIGIGSEDSIHVLWQGGLGYPDYDKIWYANYTTGWTIPVCLQPTGMNSWPNLRWSNFPVLAPDDYYIVTDENGTVIPTWNGDNYTDIDDLKDHIDDVIDPGGGDPLDPDPGTQGWDTEGPFTRFKMRLYILFIGLGCLFAPLWAMAYKKLDAPGYAGCFIVMVMGVGLLWSITGI